MKWDFFFLLLKGLQVGKMWHVERFPWSWQKVHPWHKGYPLPCFIPFPNIWGLRAFLWKRFTGFSTWEKQWVLFVFTPSLIYSHDWTVQALISFCYCPLLHPFPSTKRRIKRGSLRQTPRMKTFWPKYRRSYKQLKAEMVNTRQLQ